MSHFLQYWNSYRSADESATFLRFSASNQFARLNVSVGDSLWIVTLLKKRLILLGRLDIHGFIDGTEAQRRFGPDVYEREIYAVPRKSDQNRVREVVIHHVAEQLRFEGRVDRLPSVSDPKVALGRHLQSLRRLTPESVELLDSLLESGDRSGTFRNQKSWAEDICAVLAAIGGVGTLEEIYAKAEEIRARVPHSSIRRTIQMNSTDSSVWAGAADLFYSVEGIGKGIWGLRSMLSTTPTATDVSSLDLNGITALGDAAPGRIPTQVSRIIRDTALSRQLKALHRYACQICGHAIRRPNGLLYAEAHHIRPLGAPHHGADTQENIIVVCPNHHAELDFACRALAIHELRKHRKHSICEQSLAYHNELHYAKGGIRPDG